MTSKHITPLLLPYEPAEFWDRLRSIVKEEIKQLNLTAPYGKNVTVTIGLTEKPLYKIEEVCELFKISRPTIYDWVKHDKLHKIKIRSRVYFLGNEIRELLKPQE